MTQVKVTYADIWKISFPVLLGTVANTLVNVTDTAFLGRVGVIELGAAAVGGILYFVFAMIGVAISTGTQILIARRSGEKRDGEIGDIFDHSLLIMFVLSVLIFIILKFLSPFLIGGILKSPELKTACIEFLSYRSYGIFFIMLASGFRAFYVGIARTTIYGIYAILMAALNIVAGYVLIFGKAGLSPMGIAGAGLASSIAEFLAFVLLLVYTLWRKDFSVFRLFRFQAVSYRMIAGILNLSTPLVLQNLLSMGAWFLFFVFIEKSGEQALAVSNVVRSVYMISMTPLWGFSIAANSMTSNIIGQGKGTEVMTLLNRTLGMALIVVIAMVGINLLMPAKMLGIFTDDKSIIAAAFGSLHVINVAMIFFGTAIVAIGALSGTGATRMALYIEIAAIILYMVYITIATFSLHASVEAVWFSEVIYWLFTGVVSYLYIRSGRWKRIMV